MFWRSLVESANAVAVVESTRIFLEVKGGGSLGAELAWPPKDNAIMRIRRTWVLNTAWLMNQKVIIGAGPRTGESHEVE